jgi:alpha-glucosidase
MIKRYLTLALLLIVAAATERTARAQQEHEPVANDEATVVTGDARFTVLTPELIRMEWEEDGEFEDRASLVFIDRRLPVPEFSTRDDGGDLVIETEALTLRYQKGSGKFDEGNVSIDFSVAGVEKTWRPGMENEGNLKGTIRTLDGVQGSVEIDPGLISREGWVVVDDSDRPLFDGSDWPWATAREDTTGQDLYFFGHGHDYKQALDDFTTVAGHVPIPPRFAFGKWWSRYWAYTDRGFMDLAQQYETHDIPLEVLVVDMDWHNTLEMRWSNDTTDQAGQFAGWTGYTWNETYFPEPEKFLDWAERQNIKIPLNLHPASGIQPHEKQYEAMARAMGIDPDTEEYVPFDIVDKEFAKNYFDIVIHPLEEQGVDFWWLDWQQWSTTALEGVTPTWWLNYVFFTDMRRQNEERPLIYHRWGGLGNHRYQIGFSGDAAGDWATLKYETYFTPTASNVAFGFWSHDIGGHYKTGESSPELFTRWMQFGAFSPVLRTHATKDPEIERRIWAYPHRYARAMRETVHRRYRMLPYIYTAARQTYEKGIGLQRPMYYSWPEADEAYEYEHQYMFGDDMLVAPIASPTMEDSMLARKEIWLPEGEWVEWDTGRRLDGGRVARRTFPVGEMPVYIRAGSVIPMQRAQTKAQAEHPNDPLVLTVFPGGSDTTHVYEDAGNSLGYLDDEYAKTPIRKTRLDERTLKIEVDAPNGEYPGMSERRAHEIRLPGAWPPESVTYDGRELSFSRVDGTVGWRYESDFTTVITLPEQPRSEPMEVTIAFPAPIDSRLLNGMRGMTSRMRRTMELYTNLWKKDWAPESFIDLVQTGRRIAWTPDSAVEELKTFHRQLPKVLERLPQEMEGDEDLIRRGLNHLHAVREAADVTWDYDDLGSSE